MHVQMEILIVIIRDYHHGHHHDNVSAPWCRFRLACWLASRPRSTGAVSFELRALSPARTLAIMIIGVFVVIDVVIVVAVGGIFVVDSIATLWLQLSLLPVSLLINVTAQPQYGSTLRMRRCCSSGPASPPSSRNCCG